MVQLSIQKSESIKVKFSFLFLIFSTKIYEAAWIQAFNLNSLNTDTSVWTVWHTCLYGTSRQQNKSNIVIWCEKLICCVFPWTYFILFRISTNHQRMLMIYVVRSCLWKCSLRLTVRQAFFRANYSSDLVESVYPVFGLWIYFWKPAMHK